MFLLRVGFWLLRGDDYGGGYFVLGFEVEELDALGTAAGGADGFGVDADDLAELADDHELAGLVDEVDASDLADLGAVFKTEFPKWESLKNKSGKSGMFSSPKTDRKLPSFHQQSTTTSPPKHHVLPPVFAKNPGKNTVPPPQKKLLQKRPSSSSVSASSGDDDGGHFVLVFKVEDLDAATRANSPTTENAPGMFQNPSATKFLWRKQLGLIA
jgi:hypothetical protein